jgi:hypothetical protein
MANSEITVGTIVSPANSEVKACNGCIFEHVEDCIHLATEVLKLTPCKEAPEHPMGTIYQLKGEFSAA